MEKILMKNAQKAPFSLWSGNFREFPNPCWSQKFKKNFGRESFQSRVIEFSRTGSRLLRSLFMRLNHIGELRNMLISSSKHFTLNISDFSIFF